MTVHKTCDGVRRRDFLRIGAAGGAGLTLANYLRMAAAGEVAETPARSAIFVNLPGGPSHMDTFDLKPDAPSEFRGTFNPIKTNVPGIEISEHLPKLASCADRFVILRGVSHTLGAHRLGQEYVNTGNKPLASLEYPGYGAVFTREFSEPSDLPPFVAIPNSNQRPGYLGVQYAPLNTGNTPQPGQPFTVRGISLTGGLTVNEVKRRQGLLSDLDQTFAGLEENNQLLKGLDEFNSQAHSIITSRRAREAFDISKESADFAAKFGETPFGQSCLLATRLVESGVGFVTLNYGGWDTHRDNFTRLKDDQLPPLSVVTEEPSLILVRSSPVASELAVFSPFALPSIITLLSSAAAAEIDDELENPEPMTVMVWLGTKLISGVRVTTAPLMVKFVEGLLAA